MHEGQLERKVNTVKGYFRRWEFNFLYVEYAAPHPAFGHLLPQEGREKAIAQKTLIADRCGRCCNKAFSRFFQWEKVPDRADEGKHLLLKTKCRLLSFSE
jgi:hypothetical protein